MSEENRNSNPVKITRNDINAIIDEMENVKKEISTISQEISIIDTLVKESRDAMDVVNKMKEMKEMKKDMDDILVPIGRSIFLHCSVSDLSKLVVDIGGNVYTEMGIDKTLETIDEKIDELNKMRENESKKLQEMQNKYNEMSQFLQSTTGSH